MLAEDIATYLASKGLGVLGTNIGIEFPATPDDFMVVREYPGSAPVHVKGRQAPVLREPRFQVSCRSRSTRAAMLRAESAYGHLAGFSGVINGTPYASIRALQDPFPIGRDDNGRERVVCNFEVIR